MVGIKILDRLKNKLYQSDVKQFYEESSIVIHARDSIGKSVLGRALVVGGIGIAALIGAYSAYENWKKNRDTDGDGIKDIDEMEKYNTDPNRKDSDYDGLSDYDEVFVYNTDPLKPNPNVKKALDLGLGKYIDIFRPLDNDEVQDTNEKQFVELMAKNKEILEIPTLIRYLKDKASDGIITEDELKYSSNFASLVKNLYNIIYEEKNLYENNPNLRIINPLQTIDYSSDLGLRLGFDKELAKDATAKAIGYYGIAVVDRKLPENFDEIYLLTRATQIDKYGDKLVDFSPIVFYSVDGNHYVLIPDAGRETWLLAKHLKLIEDSGFDILNHPEMFEALNVKVIANAYSIFDAPYGISYAEQFLNGRILKPTDEDVLDLMMLQWNLYSNKAPQFGGENKLYNRDFPWYDSDKLDVLYQDPNNRRQALFSLFFLDNAAFDMKSARVVAGLEGAKIALLQAEESYEIISRLYPNGKVRHEIWGDVPAWWYYYDWIEDRGVNRLENTHLQYVGVKPLELWDLMVKHPENFPRYIEHLNAIDQHLTKNWKYWDLMKFVMGYKRWHHVKGMIEEMSVNYTIPQTLKAFGFPTYFVYLDPVPAGAGNYEWVVCLPDDAANKLRNEFGDRIIIGPANGFGLYLCKEGLIKDGVKDIRGLCGGTLLYKSKDGTIKANAFLAPNFMFYLMRR